MTIPLDGLVDAPGGWERLIRGLPEGIGVLADSGAERWSSDGLR